MHTVLATNFQMQFKANECQHTCDISCTAHTCMMHNPKKPQMFMIFLCPFVCLAQAEAHGKDSCDKQNVRSDAYALVSANDAGVSNCLLDTTQKHRRCDTPPSHQQTPSYSPTNTCRQMCWQGKHVCIKVPPNDAIQNAQL